MKIRMIQDWSDQPNHPKKDTELVVQDVVYDSDGKLESYICKWGEAEINVYPYECERL